MMNQAHSFITDREKIGRDRSAQIAVAEAHGRLVEERQARLNFLAFFEDRLKRNPWGTVRTSDLRAAVNVWSGEDWSHFVIAEAMDRLRPRPQRAVIGGLVHWVGVSFR